MRRAVAALALTFGLLPAIALGLTDEERAGRTIFLEGSSPSGGTISARIGMGSFRMPGTAVPCGNCHGEDGLGRAEAGVLPSNIRWSELTKPYGHQHPGGRAHPAFDERSLRQSILAGTDPAGNPLDPAMPRYEMSERDLAALIAYLKRLEHVQDPGLAAEALRVGTLLPQEGRLGGIGRAVAAMLSAYFDTVNAAGGVHGRRLELVVEPAPEGDTARLAAARRLVSEREVFALLSPFSAGMEAALSEMARAARVPVIGPMTLYPEPPSASNHYVFHLLPGAQELAGLLAQHEARSSPGASSRGPLALLHADDAAAGEGAAAFARQLEATGWRQVERFAYRPGAPASAALVDAMRARGVEAVLVLGPGADVPGLARLAEQAGWWPRLLIPGPLAPRGILDLPGGFAGRVMLAYPTLPTDQKPERLREYAALFKSRPLDRAHQPEQVAAYAAAVLLTEVLKRTGRELSRRKLVATLEAVQDFETGMLPQVSYNADRRIGSLGGYLVTVDLEHKRYIPVGSYVPLR